MDMERIRQLVLSLSGVAEWPLFVEQWTLATARVRHDWELPLMTCTAVGGCADDALPGCAAIGLTQLAITMTDDILDKDPRGLYHQYGAGSVANLALALQATAIRVLRHNIAAGMIVNQIFIDTAIGQAMDVAPAGDEASYWQIARAKSSPFYAGSMALGGVLGQASTEVVDHLRELGGIVGECIQVQDDLVDVFATPASPDWLQDRNNLLILYGRTAEYDQHERFEQIRPHVSDVDVLEEAQQILIDCGAIDYVLHVLQAKQKEMLNIVTKMNLADERMLHELIEHITNPIDTN